MSTIGQNSVSKVTPIFGGRKVTTAEITNSTDLPDGVRGFIVGGSAGLVSVTFIDGSMVNDLFVQPGIPYPFAVRNFRPNSNTNAVNDITILF